MSLPWKKLIVALDLEDKKDIQKVVKVLAPFGVKFKIGPIAFLRYGPDLVRGLVKTGGDIFLDLKFHDIPNTMKGSALASVEMGCWSFTVHTKAGVEALTQVKQETAAQAKKLSVSRPLIFGVTELTSSNASLKEVLALAKVADTAGIDAVVASAQEASAIKKAYPKLKVVTPGIRNPKDEIGDQKRVMSASLAITAGADFIVVGRPIISKKDYLAAARDVLSY